LKKLLPTVTILLVLVGITASSMLLMTPPDSSAMPLLDATPTEPPVSKCYIVGVVHENLGGAAFTIRDVDDIDACYSCPLASSHLVNECSSIDLYWCDPDSGFGFDPEYFLYWANGYFNSDSGCGGSGGPCIEDDYYFGANFTTDEEYDNDWWDYPFPSPGYAEQTEYWSYGGQEAYVNWYGNYANQNVGFQQYTNFPWLNTYFNNSNAQWRWADCHAGSYSCP